MPGIDPKRRLTPSPARLVLQLPHPAGTQRPTSPPARAPTPLPQSLTKAQEYLCFYKSLPFNDGFKAQRKKGPLNSLNKLMGQRESISKPPQAIFLWS